MPSQRRRSSSGRTGSSAARVATPGAGRRAPATPAERPAPTGAFVPAPRPIAARWPSRRASRDRRAEFARSKGSRHGPVRRRCEKRAERTIQLIRRAQPRSEVRPDDEIQPVGKLPDSRAHQRAQTSFRPVSNDCIANGFGHNKTDTRRETRTSVGSSCMDNEELVTRSNATHCARKVDGLPQSVACGKHAPGSQAESFSRPLRRRPARIARPARVDIRRRKPCVRARRRLLGWKVRLLTMISVTLI